MKSSGFRLVDQIRMRWRSLWHRRQLEQELQEEIAFHQSNLMTEFRRQGLTEAEARRRTRLELGGPAQISEEARDQRGWRILDQLIRDSRVAFRTFRKQPGFTITAVLTIALGMGANAGLFTLMHAVLFRPLPVTDAGTMRNIYFNVDGSRPRKGFGSSSFISFREFQDIRTAAAAADLAGIAQADVSWRGLPGRAIRAQLVSDNLLPLIGARPILGRFFLPEETRTPGSAPVVVLSHAIWARQLGRDSAIIGKPVTLNRTVFTVIGVADEASRGPLLQAADLWIPLTMQRLTRPGESLVDDERAAWIQPFTRLRPGTGETALQAEMQLLGARAITASDSGARVTASVMPASFMNTPNIRSATFSALALIWLAVSMILIVACANVANMLLARGFSRQREIAVRLAIGAGRGRLLAQLLTESAWLGIIGGTLGLVLAFGLGIVVAAFVPASMGLQLDLSPDRSVLAFTTVVSILSGVAFGLLPALQATRLDLTPGLKTEGLMAAGRPRARLQQTLVGLQVAVCVVLLVNAGLLVRSFGRVVTAGVGKPLDHMLIGSFDLRQQQYTQEQAEEFFRRMEEQVGAEPSVVATGASMLDPELDNANSVVSSGDSAATGNRFQASFDEVGAGYFAAAGLTTLAGRTFTEQEIRAASDVVVVDQRLADERLGGRAVGQRLWLGSPEEGPRPYEIIGVVNSTMPVGMGSQTLPTYFAPMAGLRYLEGKLWVRYRGDPGPAVTAIKKAAEAIDVEVATKVRTIEDNLELAMLPMKIMSGTLSALGGLALSLASIGLFGVIGFAVGRRAREIAVRIALGAAPRQILLLVGRQALIPVGYGLASGLVAAIAIGHLIRGILHGLSPFDPVAIGLVIVAVMVGSALAFWIPARRATSVQAASVLRVD